jgi:hypothetical protein
MRLKPITLPEKLLLIGVLRREKLIFKIIEQI